MVYSIHVCVDDSTINKSNTPILGRCSHSSWVFKDVETVTYIQKIQLKST